jgi:hypothetical protein
MANATRFAVAHFMGHKRENMSYPFDKDMHIRPPSRLAAAFTTYHFKKKNPKTIYVCFLG